MAITLDPKEVRAHLHKLGYCNITPGQLKEFIKDLKKLIKYDQRLLCTCNDSKPSKVCGSSNQDTTRETMRTLNSNSTQSVFESRPTERPKSAHSSVSSKQKCVSYASTNDENSSRSCTSCSVDIPDAEVRSKKYTQFSKPREPQKARSIENLPDHTRPKSSFIKPWNIHSGLQPGMVKKSDPVSLYKYYQDIWKQQKVPGESSHSDLRWCIREQMLGTDPHPRPVSQASSIGSRRSRRV